MGEGRDFLERALSKVLSNSVCTSAWLGYGQPLFIGFGPQVLPVRDGDGHRPVPAAEIQTSMADWCIGQVTGDDEPAVAQQAVESLIGLHVVNWILKENGDLIIAFTDRKTLEIICANELDEDLDEWWICCRDSYYVGIGPRGNVMTGNSTDVIGKEGNA